MIDILTELIGQPPTGYEFLLYIFAFILVLVGVLIIYNIACAFADFLYR